ncbi:hypothetical protein [Streptomyces sp. NPDC059874]|uniref:hypothetical protein n=1 Tax=Streptomyces sp. NPDC059874 TaxID=3346983 RepID=UPI00364F60C4
MLRRRRNVVPTAQTWAWLKRQAHYQLTRLAYLAGGLAGLGLFGAGDLGSTIFTGLPWLRALFILSAMAAGVPLAKAWVKCLLLDAVIDREHGHELTASRGCEELPPIIQRYVRAAIVLIILSAVLLVVAAFWSAVVSGNGAG